MLGRRFLRLHLLRVLRLTLLIVYAAEPTAELARPLDVAIALSVRLAPTATGPVYTVEPVVGVLPSVV